VIVSNVRVYDVIKHFIFAYFFPVLFQTATFEMQRFSSTWRGTRTWSTTQHIRKHPKKRRQNPTSGCGCVHPRKHPSGSRDHFGARPGPLPVTSLPVASPRSTSANANWAVPIYYSGGRSVVFFVYSGTPEEQKSIWDLLILYFFSIFFLQLIGLYILFTVHSLTLFRHRSAIDFPERNGLQRQSSVPSRSRCRCILRQ
jgi:hypothetical protein